MIRFSILLCARDGGAHLAEQLESYTAQTHDGWDLWVSDDGSTDDTRDQVRAFADTVAPRHAVRLVEGPRRGPTANFLSLLCHTDLPTDRPVALSDQDDIWWPDKLSRAAAAMDAGPATMIYGAQSLYVDARGRPIGRSRPPRRPPSFRNALVQNVVSGHSLVLSPAALDIVRSVGAPDGVSHHDWWLYALVAGAGGDVVVDRATVVSYRQHRANAMGAHRGWRASLTRAWQVLSARYGDWLAVNHAALARAGDVLTPEHRALVEALVATDRRIGLERPRAFARAGLYRQSRPTNAALYLAAAIGRA